MLQKRLAWALFVLLLVCVFSQQSWFWLFFCFINFPILLPPLRPSFLQTLRGQFWRTFGQMWSSPAMTTRDAGWRHEHQRGWEWREESEIWGGGGIRGGPPPPQESIILFNFFGRWKWDAVLHKRLAWALFVLLLSTLVCYQPTELIWALLFHKLSNFTPPPFHLSQRFVSQVSKSKTLLPPSSLQHQQSSGGLASNEVTCRATQALFNAAVTIVDWNVPLSSSDPPPSHPEGFTPGSPEHDDDFSSCAGPVVTFDEVARTPRARLQCGATYRVAQSEVEQDGSKSEYLSALKAASHPAWKEVVGADFGTLSEPGVPSDTSLPIGFRVHVCQFPQVCNWVN